MRNQTLWYAFASLLMVLAVVARSLPRDSLEPVLREVSIKDMLGPRPLTLSSTTAYNGEYSVPRNLTVSAKTESGDVEARGIASPPFGCSFGDMCNCQPKRFKSVRWVTQSTSKVSGAVHRISEPLCPPGTIGKSYAYSYSYQISVQAGPDIKGAVIPYLDKFGIRAGFSYTWGRAQTSTYTVQCSDPKNGHPCVEIFTPDIGIISGIAYILQTAAGRETHVALRVYMTHAITLGKEQDRLVHEATLGLLLSIIYVQQTCLKTTEE
ncbi:hypothetical protein FPCIR_11176 [Fusarium pseudocircinatum]|uniref:Uncharacterized protein n=1 Tax=Fusarium pseudocircinatum TaxID=56676 RepID=A0A8H5NV08_9HYPO|nr:hypothetical protein FPCIR_11176 [Fusarium pseudocircinatum]